MLHKIKYLFFLVNMQRNSFQSQLEAFTVLQSVVLELYSAFLRPGLGQ